jgi:hypothetical protein
MLESVRRALDEYERKYRRPGLEELRLSGLYALFPDELPTADVTSRWNDQWPHSDEAGVYFIFASSGRLLYVGKASMNHRIGNRLSFYFGSDRTSQKCVIVHESQWRERPMFVAAVAVPKDMKFEASALEEYLIVALDPQDNVRGRQPDARPAL